LFLLVVTGSVVSADEPAVGDGEVDAVATAEEEPLPPAEPAMGPSFEAAYNDYLSTDAIGARDFIKANPKWDGRGVVVAVLDTGVDMSVSGLTTTSTGEVKVIEAIDFSGQGHVHLETAVESKERDEPILKAGRIVLRGHQKLSPAPSTEGLLLGVFEESRFKNSSLRDINRNGRSDDRFAVLLGKLKVEEKEGDKAEEKWFAWVDLDGDGQIDDEKPMEQYSDSHQFFHFAAPGDVDQKNLLAMAISFSPEHRSVTLHFADGSHGTHVAGIAAGNGLFGKKGFNGIAPGARVMSLKIGDNRLAGGSTTSSSMEGALRFAAEWSSKHNTPVIANVSYGIGSEMEGESDIDWIVDDLMRRHPKFAVATSAGNSGPGLSTVGTPAGSFLAFSTGALLTRNNAQAQYSARIGRDQVFFFSSRGGELAKPDGLCPGSALSQVPRWESWALMRGTSMASPQAAGALALLASAAMEQRKDGEFYGALAARALRNSGKPLAGYTPLDQGAGVVNVPAAFESYKAIAGRPAAAAVAGYRSQADSPTSERGYAFNAFFRAGTYVPRSPEVVSVRVTPEFFENSKYPGGTQEFMEVLDLTVEGDDFLSLPSDALSFRRDGGASIDISYKSNKLSRPGIYTAILRGTPRELSSGKLNTVFEMWHVVVVPYVFDLSSGFSRSFRKEKLAPGELKRYFLRVPEGAAGMTLKMGATPGSDAVVNMLVFRPDGREYDFANSRVDSGRDRTALLHVPGGELEPGVWEVVADVPITARESAQYDLETSFSGFQVQSTNTVYLEEGELPVGRFSVRPLFDQSFVGRGSGAVFGIYKEFTKDTSGDRMSFYVVIDKDEVSAKLVIKLSKKDFAKFTDIAVNVIDDQGQVVDKTGFGSRILEVYIPKARHGVQERYKVEVLGALAKSGRAPVKWEVEEYHERIDAVAAHVRCEYGTRFQLFPGKLYDCEFELQTKPALAPGGYLYYGLLRFRDERSNVEKFILPLKFELGR